jgi:hypothetical protein
LAVNGATLTVAAGTATTFNGDVRLNGGTADLTVDGATTLNGLSLPTGAISVTAGGISTTNGAISAGGASGSLSAATTVTAGTGITASSGNIVATTGNIQASSGTISGLVVSGGTVTATNGLDVTTSGGISFVGKLRSNVVTAANNTAINSANGAIFIYTGALNTLDPSLFGGGSNGDIIWVYSPTLNQTAFGCGISAGEAGCFINIAGSWKVVAQD